MSENIDFLEGHLFRDHVMNAFPGDEARFQWFKNLLTREVLDRDKEMRREGFLAGKSKVAYGKFGGASDTFKKKSDKDFDAFEEQRNG